MGQSTCEVDLGTIYQGTALASGGTFIASYAIPANKVVRLVAVAMLSSASGGTLSAGASLRAEYVVKNSSGSAVAISAITGASPSTNPLNSNTAGEAAAHVQASDTAFENVGGGLWPTLVWSVSGANALATVTNNSATSITANVTVVISAIIVGST